MIKYNLIGKQFNRLLVIEKTVERLDKRILWLCKCSCGKYKKLTSSRLLRGCDISCGCYNIERMKNNSYADGPKTKPGESGFRELLGNYIRNAKKSNREFSLTPDSFKKLTQQPCYYCEAKPTQIQKADGRKLESQVNGNYIYNGIDRKDNTLGYTIDNSAACCWFCNKLKGSFLSTSQMLEIKNVLIRWRKKREQND